jgi:tetratricopeptide (TPR) repeat protein
MNIESEYKDIYELNNKSPLFVRIASDEMEKNHFEDAISILQNGIELYENYPTPYFLLGKIFLKNGDIVEAEECFQKGNSLLNCSKTLNYYKNVNSEIIEDSVYQSVNENKIDSDELEELANVLKSAKIKVNLDEDFSFVESSLPKEADNFLPPKGLVSETLASIYFDQSNYREAKAIYETLIDIQPQRAEHFQKRIAEINSRMKS